MSNPPKPAMVGQQKIDMFLRLYPDYNKRVEQENQLINNRLTWMITIQSFIIATVGLVYSYYFQSIISFLTSNKDERSLFIVRRASNLIWRILMSFSFIGLAISVVSGLLIYTACVSIESIEKKWEEQKDAARTQITDAAQKQIFFLLPDITNGGPTFFAKCGKALLMLMPTIFVALWIAVMYLLSMAKIKP